MPPQLDIEQLAVSVVGAMKSALQSALAPVLARLKAVEEREPQPGPTGEKGIDGAQGAPGLDGKDGANGRDGVDGADGLPGEKGEPGAPGAPGERGPEGPEGKPGRDGRDGLPGVQGEKGLDGKNGRDGVDGQAGKDGLGFDDLAVEHDGERGFTLRFTRGDQVKSFSFTVPALIYRSVYREGAAYAKGDVVTWAGSAWACHAATTTKPGDGSKDWQLMVKRGDIGKPGLAGAKGLDGKDGRPGRDLTQTDGVTKW